MLLRRLQAGEHLQLPQSRPMLGIGVACYELRIVNRDVTWRIVYGVDTHAVVILDVFAKKTAATPRTVVRDCQRRWAEYRRIVGST